MNAVSDERAELLESGIAGIQMLSSVFLELPDEEGLRALLALDVEEVAQTQADQELARFIVANRERDVSEVLDDIGRDRVVLVRGIGANCIKPPYESLYRGCEPNVSIGALNRFYVESGFAPTGAYKDTSDQIGIELAFVASLMQAELDEIRAGNVRAADELAATRTRFINQHLGCWAERYADAMFAAANTGYYRVVALLLKEAVAL